MPPPKVPTPEAMKSGAMKRQAAKPKSRKDLEEKRQRREADAIEIATKQWYEIEDPRLAADAVTKLIDQIFQLDLNRIRNFITNEETYSSPEMSSSRNSSFTRGYRTGRFSTPSRSASSKRRPSSARSSSSCLLSTASPQKRKRR